MHARVSLVAADTMGVCSKETFGAAVEVGLSMYYAVKTDAWKLGSAVDSVCAVASAGSAGGLLLCLALMLWRKHQGQPVTHGWATPVMLLAEGLYGNDRCMLDSAAVLLPVHAGAIVALWLPVSVIGATVVDHVILAALLYYCLALVCHGALTGGDTTDRFGVVDGSPIIVQYDVHSVVCLPCQCVPLRGSLPTERVM